PLFARKPRYKGNQRKGVGCACDQGLELKMILNSLEKIIQTKEECAPTVVRPAERWTVYDGKKERQHKKAERENEHEPSNVLGHGNSDNNHFRHAYVEVPTSSPVS